MEPRPELTVGSNIGGKFVLEALLGTGAMGTVYLARHVALDAQVALKILHPHLNDNERIVARFLEEARALASLKSDHIARVLDTGRTREGVVFIALEYVVGRDLEQELRERERLEPAQAVHFALDICNALAEVHGRGIIHRDIKPENLLVERRQDGTERIKLADFGVAKRLHTKRERALTYDATPVGTPCYMAPEQIADSSSVDTRADIFSLGVVLYEMLSGFLPFGGSSTTETYAATLQANPTPLAELAPHVPAGLAAVVERCLGKSREDRYPDIGELALALAQFGSAQDRSTAQATNRSLGATEVDLDDPAPRLRWSSTPTSAPVHTSLVPEEDIPGISRRPSAWFIWGAAAALALAIPVATSPTVRDVLRGRQPAASLWDGLAVTAPQSSVTARAGEHPRPEARPVLIAIRPLRAMTHDSLQQGPADATKTASTNDSTPRSALKALPSAAPRPPLPEREEPAELEENDTNGLAGEPSAGEPKAERFRAEDVPSEGKPPGAAAGFDEPE